MFWKSEIANPISLSVWQDPQGDVVIQYGSRDCFVFLGCWTQSGEPADYLCKLTFRDAWALRGLQLENFPYRVEEHRQSCIYEVENSAWLKQVSEQRLGNYPEWRTWDERKYKHFVVSGHDNYFDIVATDFDEQLVLNVEAGGMKGLLSTIDVVIE
jgi:hypothetical protein